MNYNNRWSLELYILQSNDEDPGGIEPQPIKLEFIIYPAELWMRYIFGITIP